MEMRDFILQQTWNLLLRKGYNGVSVSDIQEATRMARGLLYYYYENQDRLFEEAAQKYLHSWAWIERAEVKGKSLAEVIIYIVEKYRQIGEEIKECCGEGITYANLRILFLEFVRHCDSFAEVYEIIRINRYTVWKEGVLNSFALSELRSGLNLESLAHHFIYIEDSVLLEAPVKQSYHDVVYTLDKALHEFFEIIKR